MTGPTAELILVIDDEASVLAALDMLLDAWGFRVVSAESEDEAVDKLATLGEHPAAIVADYRLREGRTGVQAVERVRGMIGRTLPGIIITGDTTSGGLTAARASGLTVLQKPVLPPHLHTVLTQALRQGHA